MVHFVPADMYLAGTKDFTSGACEQGGIYNRSFFGLRLERVKPGVVAALHAFYKALQAGELAGLRRFNIIGGKMANLARTLLPAVSDCDADLHARAEAHQDADADADPDPHARRARDTVPDADADALQATDLTDRRRRVRDPAGHCDCDQ